MLSFRWAICLAAAFFLLGYMSAGHAEVQPLAPSDPANALTLARKVHCSTTDHKPAIFWWEGEVLSRRQGEKDLHLFDVEGYNIRACASITDEDGLAGYHLVSREILLYKDKDTGDVLKTWTNPWTGGVVEVLHVANDPVNWKVYEIGRDGKPADWGGQVSGPVWWQRSTIPLFYPNPLGGAYQKEIGGTYHATELFNFFGDTAELLDPETDTASATVAWTRIADWLPWMMMNGREGAMYIHTSGRKVSDYQEISDIMKSEIEHHYPEYVSPPPAGDARPNMTSWTYYQGVRDGSIPKPER